MDTNELFRSLHGARQRGDARRAARVYAKPARGPFGALVRADIVAFVRLHPSLTEPVVWFAVIIAVLLVDHGLPALAQIAVIAIAGCAVASSAGTVARQTVLIPGLDTLLPVPLAFIRASRTLMPALALSLWMACLGGVLVLLGVAGPALILLGALAGIGMGAGAVRGAARPVSDWSVPPVETPFGPLPQAQLVTLFHGLDVTMLALAPVLVSVYVGGVHPVTVMVQGLISAGALAAVLFRSR
jgi:hypothetical protein